VNFHDQLVRKYPDGKIPVRKSANRAAKANQPVRATDSRIVNETAKAGLLASAQAAEREAVEWERKAEEKSAAVLRAPRELVSYYNQSASEMRAHVELARSRANSFRKAANSLGQ
jgi:hypothetical protein